MSIIEKIEGIGQSLWYDNIERKKLKDGTIAGMISSGAIRGITSNPSIFQKAIASSKDYDLSLKPMAWSGLKSEEIFWQLAVEDIKQAADHFAQLYSNSSGKDGYVSIEVDPLLAYDTDGTVLHAKKLWQQIKRPNLMIKIPATKEGIPSVRQAIAHGINVNVTLIFSIERYIEVIDAYFGGLEDRISAGLPVDRIASVASFFVSRMDTKIDGLLEEQLRAVRITDEEFTKLAGKAAIANARLAYQIFLEKFSGERFEKLKNAGARVQRPLWASTSTKNPKYRDVIYVEELIAPDSVNTVPPNTLDAFLEHGEVAVTINNDLMQAKSLFEQLEYRGIFVKNVTDELENEGVAAFSQAYRSLLDTVEQRRMSALEELGSLTPNVIQQVQKLESANYVNRFFDRDPSLWTLDQKGQDEIKNRMNWISTPYDAKGVLPELRNLGRELVENGYTHAVLLGMGGSSLAPEVISKIVKGHDYSNENGLKFQVLDSTDPEQVVSITAHNPIDRTIFIVASKSGSTGEINAFLDYFWDQVKAICPEDPGKQFVAITDPGTRLARLAEERGFRRVFEADPQVGGRNSALTAFGLVPAAMMGIDLDSFVNNAVNMAEECKQDKSLQSNPGIVLGTIIGAAARCGRDKLTLLTNDEWISFGDWLEQLVAESSGKDGKGILPVVNEPILEIGQYSSDRLFLSLEKEDEKNQLAQQLRLAGHPVLTLRVDEKEDLAGQFYLWEIAVATACSVIGVNSFDQPDVQDAKIRTIAGLEEYKENGKFMDIVPSAGYPRAKVLTPLSETVEKRGSLFRLIGSYIEQNRSRTQYIAINAFLPRNRENEELLQKFRSRLAVKYALPTTLGFGPRYLHSTGQFHKGGPNTGLFILVTANRQTDVEIPGQGVSFGVFQRAQAIGDLHALQAKYREVLWIDLSEPDVRILLDT